MLWMSELCALPRPENAPSNTTRHVNARFPDEICAVPAKVDCVNKIPKKDLKNTKMVKHVTQWSKLGSSATNSGVRVDSKEIS